MDAAKKKALFRSKLNAAQKKDKRIESPLIRYNESDQPVCRVCNLVLKSDSHWEAHQASRKHHEAVNQLKASAANIRKNASDVKPEPAVIDSARPAHEPNAEVEAAKLPKLKPSSGLPADFFDNRETKRPKIGAETVKLVDPNLHKKSGGVAQTKLKETLLENVPDAVPSGNGVQSKNIEHGRDFTETTGEISRSETKLVKGSLPEGFFDNKEADLLARGIKIVKPDVKDEYKEFEKLIQEDLLQVDNRLEEDEIDAAETIEEAESLEQKTYREKVELLKQKKTELMAARSAKKTSSDVGSKESSSSHEDTSSDDDDSDGNFALDWRAQHL